MSRYILLLLLAFLSQPARAAWMESSSAHFVVIGNSSESNLRRFSEQLERYDRAMGIVTGVTSSTPSPSNRVTVYIVSSEEEVRKLKGDKKDRFTAGFYIPRAGGSLAIIPPVDGARNGGGDLDWSMTVLLHEYAHHFLISNSGFPNPRWMQEGAAEFFAAASFGADGSVGLGRPAQHRGPELFMARDVTATDLLDPDEYEKRRGKSTEYDAFYGKSWLLYHYLTFEPSRKGQLKAYAKALLEGKSLTEAGHVAFGDFRQLEKDLDAYLNRNRMTYIKIAGSAVQPGAITIRPLTAGEVAILPLRLRSQIGVNKETAPNVLQQALAVAERFPADAAVLSEVAEAQIDAGHEDEAIKAADAAIKIDPHAVNAYLQKGYALLGRADRTGDPVEFRKARETFLALNAFEHDHPIPLLDYYLTFVKQGKKPTANAVQALERAAILAPFDLGLRMTAAMQELRDGEREIARAFLLPVAYNPHGGKLAERAREVLERMEHDPHWDGSGMTGPIDLPDTDS